MRNRPAAGCASGFRAYPPRQRLVIDVAAYYDAHASPLIWLTDSKSRLYIEDRLLNAVEPGI